MPGAPRCRRRVGIRPCALVTPPWRRGFDVQLRGLTLGTPHSSALAATPSTLRERHAVWTVADPVVRFAHLVVRPNLGALEERQGLRVWQEVQTTFAAQILAPHFEHLCRQWTASSAATCWVDRQIGAVGPTVVADRTGRVKLELAVVGTAPRSDLPGKVRTIVVVGNVNAGALPSTLNDLKRLEQARGLLCANGEDAREAMLVLFARGGFDQALQREARDRRDVALVDPDVLFGLE